MGVPLDNPLIIGAGWDKPGRAVKALWQLGAGGVEIGGVPLHLQQGNPKPRQWTVAPGVLINALGFNSPGALKVSQNLARYLRSAVPVGVQVTVNKDVMQSDDPEEHILALAAVIRRLFFIASWFTLGVSSPNTPGMRERYEGREWLSRIIAGCIATMNELGGNKPMYIKISPDLTWEELDDVIEVAMEYGIGIVASNTTVNREIKAKFGWQDRVGGLSGDDEDFRALSTRQIAYIYTRSEGRVPIMGAGGVKDCATALEKIRAGALPLQIVSAIPGEGPGVLGRVNRELVDYMDREGVKSIQDLLGIDAYNIYRFIA